MLNIPADEQQLPESRTDDPWSSEKIASVAGFQWHGLQPVSGQIRAATSWGIYRHDLSASLPSTSLLMGEQGEYLLVIKLDFFCPALIYLPLLFLIFLGYVIYKHDKKKIKIDLPVTRYAPGLWWTGALCSCKRIRDQQLTALQTARLYVLVSLKNSNGRRRRLFQVLHCLYLGEPYKSLIKWEIWKHNEPLQWFISLLTWLVMKYHGGITVQEPVWSKLIWQIFLIESTPFKSPTGRNQKSVWEMRILSSHILLIYSTSQLF